LKLNALIKKSKNQLIKRQVMPFDKVKKILIMWDANQSKTDTDELKTFGHELTKTNKEVTFLVFYPLSKLKPDMLSNDMYQLTCKGDFNLFGVPKTKALKEVLNIKYDLLINACLTPNQHLDTIAVYSSASFRIGPYINNENTNLYEISIKPNGADLCENYLIEIGKCLNKII
jgi:hypothetical protein